MAADPKQQLRDLQREALAAQRQIRQLKAATQEANDAAAKNNLAASVRQAEAAYKAAAAAADKLIAAQKSLIGNAPLQRPAFNQSNLVGNAPLQKPAFNQPSLIGGTPLQRPAFNQPSLIGGTPLQRPAFNQFGPQLPVAPYVKKSSTFRLAPDRPAQDSPSSDGLPPLPLSEPQSESRMFAPHPDHPLPKKMPNPVAADALAKAKEDMAKKEAQAWADLRLQYDKRLKGERAFIDDLAQQHANRKQGLAYQDMDGTRHGRTTGGELGLFVGGMKEKIGGLFRNIGQGRLVQGAVGAADSFRSSKVGTALGGAAGAAGGAMVGTMQALPGIVGAIGGALKSIAAFPQTLASAFGPITNLVEAFDPGLVGMFNLAIQNLTASLGGSLQPIVEAGIQVADVFNALFTTVGPEFMPVIKTVGDELARAAVVVAQMVRPALSGLADFVKLIVENIAPLISDLTPLLKEFAGINRDLGDAMMEIWKVVLPPLVGALRMLARTVGDVIAWIRDRLRDVGVGSGSTRANPGQLGTLDLANRTTAASPAQIIGSEAIGEQARTAAFGARSIQERQLDEQERARELLAQIARNTASGGNGRSWRDAAASGLTEAAGHAARSSVRAIPGVGMAWDLADLASQALNYGGT